MQRAVIFPNYSKEESVGYADKACDFLSSYGYETEIFGEKETCVSDADVAVVLGGDGTMLRTAKILYGTDIPMFGINFGHFGYLTEYSSETAEEGLKRLVNGDYKIEKRAVISGKVVRNGKKSFSFIAINEACIHRASVMHALTSKIYINGEHTEDIVGDGVIVSTATGSTSYNLSASGPILTPTSENMVITPLAPKYFPDSSIVTAPRDKITVVTGENFDGASLEIDGNERFTLKSGDKIEIKKAPRSVKIIKMDEDGFYIALRKKLSK